MKAELTPDFNGELRKHLVKVPESIYLCRGMRIFGRRVKSIIFTTDLAIIRNSNADAVLAASLFHFNEMSVGELKDYLMEHGVHVRKEK